MTNRIRVALGVLGVTLAAAAVRAQVPGEKELAALLQGDRPYHAVDAALFDRFGWDLPDKGASVKALADAAPGGAFDPRKLEALPAGQLGYRAKWHELRYRVYGLDWDIGALHLTPNQPVAGLPTLVILHGGSGNWYEFFVDQLNNPGLGQYLAQKIPVLLLTIPGNYKHGGWTDNNFGERVPAFLLDREISPQEGKLRNAVFTFRVVVDGVRQIIEKTTTGPIVMIGHSTGGEVPFLLMNTSLKPRFNGLYLGWGSGGPAGLDSLLSGDVAHRKTVFSRFSKYKPVQHLRIRSAEEYAFDSDYIGPLNPCLDQKNDKRDQEGRPDDKLQVATCWFKREERRRPGFKQKLQDLEHGGAVELREQTAKEIRDALRDNALGVKPDEVISDLFITSRAPMTGYRKMLWTVGKLDGHARIRDGVLSEARVAEQFRKHNPGIPIRTLLFDVPMTHFGHIERPRQLAGALVAGIRWLVEP
jgi:hypothetical protein